MDVRSAFEKTVLELVGGSRPAQAHGLPDTVVARSKFGSLEVERLVCEAAPLGVLGDLLPRQANAWHRGFPALDTLGGDDRPERPLRFCIATEEIVGPVRNGGIGTTYAYLAETLALAGYDVTILYLRGNDVENGTVEQWIDHYGAKGVKFVPVPNYALIDRLQTGADRWLQAPYNMLRYLLLNPMDAVHVSEWHGSSYLCLLAKRQGLAFDKTLFIVKTSSPWLWNRLYGSHPLERAEDLTKIYAERQSVELADIVIGGSAHLLRWMASQGYALPPQRTFVQPNVVSFDHLKGLGSSRAKVAGTRIKIDEIVFFGRLESRKGLLTFCEAIKRLVYRGNRLPARITFMGKPGARLTARPDQDIVDYIRSESAGWPCEVQILTELQQMDAIRYLLDGARLAVMPSVIENSSLAVYEATICGIPFIASNSGGTPELVLEEDRAHVLCDAHPIPLANKIEDAVLHGGFVARPSFDNDANIEEWKSFHGKLTRGLLEELLIASRSSLPPSPHHVDVSVCVYHRGTPDELELTLRSLRGQTHPPEQIIVGVDTTTLDRSTLSDIADQPVVVVDCDDFDAGLAYNAMETQARSQFCLFMWSGSTLIAEALDALRTTASNSGADVVNYFHKVVPSNGQRDTEYLNAFIIGSVSETFFRSHLSSMPLLVRREAFAAAAGFTTDYRVLCSEHEFVARCQVLGLKCTTALMEMGTVAEFSDEWLSRCCYDIPASHFRAIRPQIAAAPLAMRELLLLSKGFQAKSSGKLPKQKKLPPVKRPAKLSTQTGFSRLFETLAGDRLPSPTKRPFLDQSAADGGDQERKESFALTSLRRQLTALDSTASSYSGAILGVKGRTVVGWIRNDASPDIPVDLDISVNGRAGVRVRAETKLNSAFYLPRNLDNHAFTFDVPESGIAQRLRIRPADVTIQVRDADVSLGHLHIGYASLKQGGFEGYCEILQPGAINGWAWRPREPEHTVDIALFVDGKFLIRIPCSRDREDVRQAGHGHGHYGFQVHLPKALRNGVERRIDVYVADCGLLLKNGRLRLKGDELTFA